MKEVHLVCNAHIDPIWQWDWQEGVSAVLSTFQSAVNIAEEFDYVFCHNEVTVYKYVEEYAPDLFEKIKELVKQGKWRIMGGWYLQPDCNMPAGESFVRQIQEGLCPFPKRLCPTLYQTALCPGRKMRGQEDAGGGTDKTVPNNGNYGNIPPFKRPTGQS